MLTKIKCFIKGHQLLCRQNYVLTDNENTIRHAHICIRCEAVKQFPDEPIEDEMLLMISRLVGQNQPQQEPPKTYIH